MACSMLAALCSDPRNIVYIISGRGRAELDAWFGPVVRFALAGGIASACTLAAAVEALACLIAPASCPLLFLS